MYTLISRYLPARRPFVALLLFFLHLIPGVIAPETDQLGVCTYSRQPASPLASRLSFRA